MSDDEQPLAGPRLLEWDSAFLGVRVGVLEVGLATAADELRDLLRSEGNAFDLLVVMQVGDSAAVRTVLEEVGARHVDKKLDYGSPVQCISAAWSDLERIGDSASDADRSALEALALESGQFSRFRIDPRIGEACWTDLYCLWIRNSLAGEIADAVLVHRRAGAITGFVTVKRQDAGQARIGLIGVAAEERRAGVGTKLVAAAHDWASGQELKDLRVATQQANRAACRFYESRGFSLISAMDIYHLWPTK